MPVNNSINLTPSAGGIVWSTASAFFTIAGTTTPNQIILSGNLATPAWSTATYPPTTTANQLLYSSANNTITGLASAASGALITSAGSVPSISQTLPTAVQANITQLGAQSQALNMNSHLINNVTDPVSAQDAATRAYVDTVAAGLSVVGACSAATTANLNAIYVNGASGVGATLTNNGALAAFSVDGVSPAVNSRILVKDQTSTLENGVYILTVVGSGAVAWVLTRATDYDQPAEVTPGDLVIINTGTVNGGTSWVETATVAAIGTDPILFSQFTFSATAVLLKANNLSDVANTATSFNNISPLTTKGDLIGFSTVNARLPVGVTNGMFLQVDSGAATGLAWSTTTLPSTAGAAGNILISDGTNYVASTSLWPNTVGTSGKFLISNGTSNVYSTSTIPTSAGATANKVLLSDGTNYVLSTPTFPNASATIRKIIVSDGTNWVASTETYAVPGTSGNVLTSDGTNWTSAASAGSGTVNAGTAGQMAYYAASAAAVSGNANANISAGALTLGIATSVIGQLKLAGNTSGTITITPQAAAGTYNFNLPIVAGSSGQILQSGGGAATPMAWSTPTYPSVSGTSGKFLISDGTNNVYSTSTIPSSAGATANKHLISDGTNYILSTPTFPNSATSTGTILRADGTNWVATTATYPNVGTSTGSFLYADGTNWVASTSLWPNTVGSSGKVVISNGTSNVYSTPTFPNASATSGKIIKSDGTNWVASTETYAAPGASGNVLTSDGTNWTSAAPAGGGGLTTATVTLTQSNIQNMYATPVQLLAAPGANTVIVVVSASVYLNFQTTAFTAGAGKNMSIQYGNTNHAGGASAINSSDAPSGSTFMNATSSRVQFCGTRTAVEFTGVSNQGIFASNGSGAITGGNAASTIVVTLQYYTITATT